MKVEVLGTGCPKCRKLEMLVTKTVADLGLEAEIIKVETLPEIMAYGVTFTPALVINGVVKSSGRLPKVPQLSTWLTEASEK